MKRNRMVVFVALLLVAAAFGWLLPSGVFWLDDGKEEEQSVPMQIKQVNLNYQSDLDTESRLIFARDVAIQGAITPLDHGIYLQRQDVEEICEQFLWDLTEASVVSRRSTNTTPALLSTPNGTIIVWTVNEFLNERWSWEAVIDDQTGLLLSCRFYEITWPEFFLDFDGAGSAEAYIASRISDALCKQYNDRLDGNLTVEEQQNNIVPTAYYTGRIILSENEDILYHIPLTISAGEGWFMLN